MPTAAPGAEHRAGTPKMEKPGAAARLLCVKMRRLRLQRFAGERPSFRMTVSRGHGLLRVHAHRRQPAKAVRLKASGNAEKFVGKLPRDGSRVPVANLDAIH